MSERLEFVRYRRVVVADCWTAVAKVFGFSREDSIELRRRTLLHRDGTGLKTVVQIK